VGPQEPPTRALRQLRDERCGRAWVPPVYYLDNPRIRAPVLLITSYKKRRKNLQRPFKNLLISEYIKIYSPPSQQRRPA